MAYIYIIAFALVIGALMGVTGVVSLGSHRDNIRGTNGRLAESKIGAQLGVRQHPAERSGAGLR